MKDSNYFIKGIKEKKKKVILEIYQNVFPNVKRFVLQNRGQQTDAEDVFQKALLQIITRVEVKSFEIKSSFEAYLFVACKNLWRRELNKNKRMVTNGEVKELGSNERDLASGILEQERWEFFQEKLEEISENCKQILKRFFNEIPYESIAKELGYNDENVVRQRVFKCKSKLAEIIKTDVRFKQLKEL
ncbi:RNA polymerase sigma factor [Lacinutrix cladophorae]